jgi:sortase A
VIASKPRWVIYLLAAIGLVCLVDGSWIYAKAWLAQELIGIAWQRNRAGVADAKPWWWADTRPMAKLSIGRGAQDLIVLEGSSGRNLAFGPVHDAASVLPGQPGNSVIEGHRDTHFRVLRGLNRGDPISVELADGQRLSFVVVDLRVADSRQSRIVLSGERPRLTLVTCYPFDAVRAGGPLRYVVTAEQRPIRTAGWQGGQPLPPAEPHTPNVASATPRFLERRDVDFLHGHHRLEYSLCSRCVGTRHGIHEHPRSDLPGYAPLVLTPPARTFGPAVVDDCIPIAVGLGLIFGDDLERECLRVFEGRAAVEAEAGDSYHRKLDRQHLALLSTGKIARGMVYAGNGAVWKGLGVKLGGFFRVVVVPYADNVLGHRLHLLIS